MDRNLALEFVRVTEAAAIATSRWVGKGDKHAADGAAVEAMRSRFNFVDFVGEVVIGEGTKDQAPELYIGEKLGTGRGPELDIAVDPLECTDSVAYGRPNAMSVIASGSKGSLFHAPDTYMSKIACGPAARGVIDLDASAQENIQKVATRLGKTVADITVLVLDRPRHEKLIKEIREVGARVRLITDGDVAGAIAPCMLSSGIDMLMGIGASAEGVLAAVAIKCLGGDLQCRLSPPNEEHRARVKAMGIVDIQKKLTLEDLAQGQDLTFTATGVLDGPLLKGVQYTQHFAQHSAGWGQGCITTHSVVMRVKTGTVRFLETMHRL